MRIVTAVLALLFLAITPFAGSSAQEAKSKPNGKLSSAEIWSRLNLEVSTKPLQERMTFKELLEYVNSCLAKNKTPVTIQVNELIFIGSAEGKPKAFESPITTEVNLRIASPNVTVARLLHLATNQVRSNYVAGPSPLDRDAWRSCPLRNSRWNHCGLTSFRPTSAIARS